MRDLSGRCAISFRGGGCGGRLPSAPWPQCLRARVDALILAAPSLGDALPALIGAVALRMGRGAGRDAQRFSRQPVGRSGERCRARFAHRRSAIGKQSLRRKSENKKLLLTVRYSPEVVPISNPRVMVGSRERMGCFVSTRHDTPAAPTVG